MGSAIGRSVWYRGEVPRESTTNQPHRSSGRIWKAATISDGPASRSVVCSSAAQRRERVRLRVTRWLNVNLACPSEKTAFFRYSSELTAPGLPHGHPFRTWGEQRDAS